MTPEEYRQRFDEDDAPGWEAIDARLADFYRGEKPATHFIATPHYALGGDDPLDGISVYPSTAGGTAHLHYVSYGLSQLYFEPEAVGKEWSRFGFELTFRLADEPGRDGIPPWPANMMQNIARYVFQSSKVFEEFHYFRSGPIRLDDPTDMTGIVFAMDPELGAIDTPHGRVEFLQVVGLATREFEWIRDHGHDTAAVLTRLRQDSPMLVTRLDRKSLPFD